MEAAAGGGLHSSGLWEPEPRGVSRAEIFWGGISRQ